MAVRILHTNDFHGTLNEERLVALERSRAQADLYFDSGDAIRTGNLGVPLRPEPVWEALDRLGCTASTLGNRESHVLDAAFWAKLRGARHPLLCANLRRRDGSSPLPPSLSIEAAGYRVGVFGVMVPMVTERMKTQAASAFLWLPPIEVARSVVAELRPQVDLLIALTHIGHRQDLELAAACPELDVILGGHSHTVLMEPVRLGRVAVCQGGSHGRYVGVYAWSPADGLTGGLEPLA